MYIYKNASLQCPSEPNPQVFIPFYSGYTDYWFNANVAGKKQVTLSSPFSTLLCGEGNDGIDRTDATYSKTNLPTDWLTDHSKPPWRHLGGANYLYTDGRVAWQRSNQVTSNYGRANCFAVQ